MNQNLFKFQLPDYIEILQNGAFENVAYAHWLIGNIYFDGIFMEQSFELAAQHYYQSACLGLGLGWKQLGTMLQSNLISRFKDISMMDCFTNAANLCDGYAQFELAKIYFYGAGVRKNIELGIKFLNMAISNNVKEAKFFLAYWEAMGVPMILESKGQNCNNLVIKANSGDAKAQYALSFILKSERIHYLQLAANQGLLEANLDLCQYAMTGENTNRNFDQALIHLRAALSTQSPIAYAYAGKFYSSPSHHYNPDISEFYFEKANEFEHIIIDDLYAEYLQLKFFNDLHAEHPIYARLASLYQKMIKNGMSNPKYSLAFLWLKHIDEKSISQEMLHTLDILAPHCHHIIMDHLGAIYANKGGINSKYFVNGKKSCFWQQAAIFENSVNSMYTLAKEYINGEFIKKNISAAKSLLSSAASLGCVSSAKLLSNLFFYNDGEINNEYYSTKIDEYCVEQGDIEANSVLAYKLHHGFGVEQNIDLANHYSLQPFELTVKNLKSQNVSVIEYYKKEEVVENINSKLCKVLNFKSKNAS